ncbi:hypothetical protein KAR91_87805, partial [Candidatus Pacearchaeota archaeon]|nr:hypothetical protein [Candidatus Pacearchaeota archaeon]
MIEMIINPKSAEKASWKMLFVGLLYGTLSLLLTHWFFSADPALSKFSGMIVVTFCVMFTLPYMYYMIKIETEEDEHIEGFSAVWKTHSDVIYGFMWLFLGFVIAFSVWNIVLGDANLLNAQIETYCMINSPHDVSSCVTKYSIDQYSAGTGAATNTTRLMAIFTNNVYVMIF